MQRGSALSPQPQRSPSLQLQSPNVPERASRSLHAPSKAASPSDAAVSSSLTGRDSRTDIETAREQGIRKRKRESAGDISSEIPEFDIDRRSDQKRRATDSIPKRIASTRDEPRVKIEEEDGEPSLERESDETDSEERFETAPQFRKTQQERPTAPPETVDSLFMELPFPPSSPESEEDSAEEPDEGTGGAVHDIDEWIDIRLRTGKAENEQQVIQALRCTSMDPDLADRVLDQLVAGKGIPQDMRGVWTPEDDRCLEGTDARDIDRLLKKHGTELYNRRFEYLEMVRAAENEI